MCPVYLVFFICPMGYFFSAYEIPFQIFPLNCRKGQQDGQQSLLTSLSVWKSHSSLTDQMHRNLCWPVFEFGKAVHHWLTRWAELFAYQSLSLAKLFITDWLIDRKLFLAVGVTHQCFQCNFCWPMNLWIQPRNSRIPIKKKKEEKC